MNINRQPAGQPTGGQFAEGKRAAADVGLEVDGGDGALGHSYELGQIVNQMEVAATPEEREEAALDGLHAVASRHFAEARGVKVRECNMHLDAQGVDCPGPYIPHQHVEGFIDEWGGATTTENEMWEKVWLAGDDQEFRAFALGVRPSEAAGEVTFGVRNTGKSRDEQARELLSDVTAGRITDDDWLEGMGSMFPNLSAHQGAEDYYFPAARALADGRDSDYRDFMRRAARFQRNEAKWQHNLDFKLPARSSKYEAGLTVRETEDRIRDSVRQAQKEGFLDPEATVTSTTQDVSEPGGGDVLVSLVMRNEDAMNVLPNTAGEPEQGVLVDSEYRKIMEKRMESVVAQHRAPEEERAPFGIWVSTKSPYTTERDPYRRREIAQRLRSIHGYTIA